MNAQVAEVKARLSAIEIEPGFIVYGVRQYIDCKRMVSGWRFSVKNEYKIELGDYIAVKRSDCQIRGFVVRLYPCTTYSREVVVELSITASEAEHLRRKPGIIVRSL